MLGPPSTDMYPARPVFLFWAHSSVVERQPFKLCVAGSIPAGLTENSKIVQCKHPSAGSVLTIEVGEVRQGEKFTLSVIEGIPAGLTENSKIVQC